MQNGDYFKWFCAFLAVCVTDILKAFRSFAPVLHQGASPQEPPAANLATYLIFISYPH